MLERHPFQSPRGSPALVCALAGTRLVALGAILQLMGCERTSKDEVRSYVRLNEVMSPNQDFPVKDGAGQPVKRAWVELHNPGASAVNLGVYSLTDDRGNPTKYRFPAGTLLEPGAYLVVFLYDQGDCNAACESAYQECLSVAQDDADRDSCRIEKVACENACSVTGLVAGFTLRRSGEPIYLFTGGGSTLVDQMGVMEQPAGTSNGIDPVTGQYGVLYVPTPWEPNQRVNFRPQRFQAWPHKAQTADCGVEIPVEFTIARDIDPPRPELQVSVEYLDLPAAGQCANWKTIPECVGAESPRECMDRVFGSRPASEAPLELLQVETILDPTRADPAGRPVPVEVEILKYRAILPPEKCGTVRLFRVTAEDASLGAESSVRVLASQGECAVYGEEPIPVLVSEYQPRNARFAFERRDSDRNLTRSKETPDWIEITNYGDRLLDIQDLGFATAGEVEQGFLDRWTFGYQGWGTAYDPGTPLPPTPLSLPAGKATFVLADSDGGSGRRWYYYWEGGLPPPKNDQGVPTGKPYFSTQFSLQADRRPPSLPDEFFLVDSRTRSVLDRVVLDFSKNPVTPYDLLPGQSAIRFSSEGTRPDALEPGTITDCPTPGGLNALDCEIAPRFEDAVTRRWTSGGASPAQDAAVTVEAQVHFDEDTPQEEARVAFSYTVDGGPAVDVSPPDLTVEEAGAQGQPDPGCVLYTVKARIPGQPAGTLVVYQLLAQDLRLSAAGFDQGKEVVFAESTQPAPAASFRYLVGYALPPDHPRLNEVLPGNGTVVLPPYACLPAAEQKHPDFAEIHNPSTGEVDLGGYYLTDSLFLGDPIARPRLWRVPGGTVVPAGGFLALYFASIPLDCLSDEEKRRSVVVTGFGLDACGEVLHLVAPDDADRGANAVVDTLSWGQPPKPGEERPCLTRDTAFGYLCEGGGKPTALESATPGARNGSRLRPPLFHDAAHEDVIAQTIGGCVDPRAIVKLTALFLIDEGFPGGFPTVAERVTRAVVFVDRDLGAGEEEFQASVSSVPPCPVPGVCLDPPSGYSGLALTLLLRPPSGHQGAYYGPVVRYRAEITDACGQTGESSPISFGTTEAEHPQVVINEINRSSPALPDTADVSWIELHNPSSSPADLSGAYLTNDPWNPRKSMLPAGSVVAPQGFLLVLTGPAAIEGAPFPAVKLDWAFAGDPPAPVKAGELLLLDSTARGTCVLDLFEFSFGEASVGTSAGRDPDGGATIRLLDAPSPGRSNVGSGPTFLRGDADSNLKLNVSDMVLSLNILFLGEIRRPECLDALDADDSGEHALTDPIYVGNFLFLKGPAPPAPYPEAGLDTTPDEVTTCGAPSAGG